MRQNPVLLHRKGTANRPLPHTAKGLYQNEELLALNKEHFIGKPLYPSPNADYGYDISDYKSIHPDYGDLEVFKQVLDGAHQRGMKVFMDLVVNHTSDEHPWFIESRKGKDNPYHDYYYWRPGKKSRRGKRLPPNNWTSMFEGGAWEYDENLDEYYLPSSFPSFIRLNALCIRS